MALESGDVAGGTELDDEEISVFTLWALDCPGSPSPVADNTTAGEVSHGDRNRGGINVFVVDCACVYSMIIADH